MYKGGNSSTKNTAYLASLLFQYDTSESRCFLQSSLQPRFAEESGRWPSKITKYSRNFSSN